MVTDQLLLGLVVCSLLLYSVAFLLGRRLAAVTGLSRDDQPVRTDDDTVRCPNCEAENERGYRFCRSCVGELPKSMQFTGRSRGAYGRLMR